MAIPLFMSVGKVNLDIQRFPLPTYVKGKLVQGSPTIITVVANVQPVVKGTGTQFLPEEAKVKRSLIVFSKEKLQQKIEYNTPTQADRFIWQGELYEVIQSVNYAMSVIDHYESVAVVVDPQ